MKKQFSMKALLYGSLFACMFAFQNCSSIFQSSELKFNPNEIMFSSKVAGADFSWLLDADNLNLALSQFNHLEKWIDEAKHHVALYPPFMPYSQVLDVSHSALLVDGINGKQLHFSENTLLSSIPQDSAQFAADEYSALMYLSKVRMPVEGAKTIRIMSLQSPDDLNNGRLTLDLNETDTAAELVAQIWFTEEAFARKSISFSKTLLDQGIALGVRFSKEAQDLALTVNGESSNERPMVEGILPRLRYVDRTLTIHSQTEGSGGDFNLSDFGLFTRSISDLELSEFSLSLQRTYEFNKPTPLSNLTGLIPAENLSMTFAQIKPIFEKSYGSNSCVNCHSELSTKSQTLTMNSHGRAWIQAGNPNDSLLIQAIRHQSTAQPMPKGGGQLNEEDIQAVEQWILQGAR